MATMPRLTLTPMRPFSNKCWITLADGAETWHDAPMDARVARTRARLQEALLELARERPAAEVSISDIAERAGINRSTFYQHYADRDTLLADALDAAAAKAGAQLRHVDLDPHMPPALLVDFLVHIAENADIYRQALTGSPSGAVIVRLRTWVTEMVRESAPGGNEIEGVPVEVLSAGFAGSVLGVISAWLEREPLAAPDVVARWAWVALFSPGRAPSLRQPGASAQG